MIEEVDVVSDGGVLEKIVDSHELFFGARHGCVFVDSDAGRHCVEDDCGCGRDDG